MGEELEHQSEDRARKTNGKVGELLTAVELLKHGFEVNWPFIDSGYDLITDDGEGAIKRIQVKTAKPNKHGTYSVSFAHGHKTKHKYTKKDIDAFVVALNYDGRQVFYVVPIEDTVTLKGIFWPVGEHPRWPEKWKTCKYESYLGRWDLLRKGSSG